MSFVFFCKFLTMLRHFTPLVLQMTVNKPFNDQNEQMTTLCQDCQVITFKLQLNN